MSGRIVSIGREEMSQLLRGPQELAAIFDVEYEFGGESREVFLTLEQLLPIVKMFKLAMDEGVSDLEGKSIYMTLEDFERLISNSVRNSETHITTINELAVIPGSHPTIEYGLKVTNQLGAASQVTLLRDGPDLLQSYFGEDLVLLDGMMFVTYESDPKAALYVLLLGQTGKKVVDFPGLASMRL